MGQIKCLCGCGRYTNGRRIFIKGHKGSLIKRLEVARSTSRDKRAYTHVIEQIKTIHGYATVD